LPRLQGSLELTIHDLTAIKLRKKLPLGNCSCIALLTYIHVGILLERVGERRIKIRQKALFDPSS